MQPYTSPFKHVPFEDYKDNWERIKLTRDDDGILTVRFHKDDGEFSWNPDTHREVSSLWNFLSLDPANKVIVLTGTGDGFLRLSDYGDSLGDADPWWCVMGHQEAKRIINDLLEIEQPMIAALNGPVNIHSQIPLLCDIVLATDDTTIGETHLHPSGIIPGDGHHVVWQALLGLNRARASLLMNTEFTAQEAKDLGLVYDITERDDLLPRAYDIARGLLELPPVTLRTFRPIMLQNMKRLMLEGLSQGMYAEGYGLMEIMGTTD